MTIAVTQRHAGFADHARFTFRLTAIVLTLLIALPLHGAWRLVRLPSPWPPLFLGAVGWIAGAQRRTIGRPLRRDVVFLSNHLSWLDILLIAGASGSAFVAKADLARVPVIGWLCTLNRTVFIDRTSRMDVAEQIATLRDALAETNVITVFPEGTTGDGAALLPFKASLLAVLGPPPPGIRVQPVKLDYGPAMADIAWLGDEAGAINARRILSRAGRFTATLAFLDPFDPAAFPGRKAIAAEARARMEAVNPFPTDTA